MTRGEQATAAGSACLPDDAGGTARGTGGLMLLGAARLLRDGL
jgi:hypothetical protein